MDIEDLTVAFLDSVEVNGQIGEFLEWAANECPMATSEDVVEAYQHAIDAEPTDAVVDGADVVYRAIFDSAEAYARVKRSHDMRSAAATRDLPS